MDTKIVFVEDDEDDIFLIDRACKAAGIDDERDFFTNGRAALNHLSNAATPESKTTAVSLIFLDLNMPVMAGLEFLRWLRNQSALRHIPVVVLTSSENPQDLKSAYDAGANAYLVKPADLSQLTKMLGCATRFWLRYNRMAT